MGFQFRTHQFTHHFIFFILAANAMFKFTIIDAEYQINGLNE
jgi:hypothetical protein